VENRDKQAQADERKRVAAALRQYFDEGPGTYRALLGYLGLEYRDAWTRAGSN
jgi:hypothetical protein